MKQLKYPLIVALFLLVAGCGGADGITKIGNPGGPPVPTDPTANAQELVESYLQENPDWTAESASGGEEFFISFDVEEQTATVTSTILAAPVKISFEILIDGSISLDDDVLPFSIDIVFCDPVAEASPVRIFIKDMDGVKLAEASAVEPDYSTVVKDPVEGNDDPVEEEPVVEDPVAEEPVVEDPVDEGNAPWWGDFEVSIFANNSSIKPIISANGRYVAFASYARITGETCPECVHIRDLKTGNTDITRNISYLIPGIHTAVTSLSAISDDGRYLVITYAGTEGPIYIYDRQEDDALLVADERSLLPKMSGDGRYIIYTSYSEYPSGGHQNGRADVFRYDIGSKEHVMVSLSDTGGEGNGDSFAGGISHDGRYVVFYSYADNIVTGDTNGYRDIFVRDMQQGTTRRILAENGDEPNGDAGHLVVSGLLPYPVSPSSSISADGRYVLFDTAVTNLYDGRSGSGAGVGVFVYDMIDGGYDPVSVNSEGGLVLGQVNSAIISNDGNYVLFSCDSGISGRELEDDNDGVTHSVCRRDMKNDVTELVETSFDGTISDAEFRGRFSSSVDGRYVAFSSDATNLVPGDTNGRTDVFVKDMLTGKITIASVPNGQ